MNILTLYVSKGNQDYFEKCLMIFCERINGIFYHNDFYIDINEFILAELDCDEIVYIENCINDFVAYSIIWKNLYLLYNLLKRINLDIVFLIDNDNGEVIKNDDLFLMGFDDFADWVES